MFSFRTFLSLLELSSFFPFLKMPFAFPPERTMCISSANQDLSDLSELGVTPRSFAARKRCMGFAAQSNIVPLPTESAELYCVWNASLEDTYEIGMVLQNVFADYFDIRSALYTETLDCLDEYFQLGYTEPAKIVLRL